MSHQLQSLEESEVCAGHLRESELDTESRGEPLGTLRVGETLQAPAEGLTGCHLENERRQDPLEDVVVPGEGWEDDGGLHTAWQLGVRCE